MLLGPDPDDPRWRPPELLARFELQAVLGRGSSGVAFRAMQRSLRRPVVLKLVAWDPTVLEVTRRRFEAEARLLARMHHPHVLAVLDHGIVPGVAYLAYPDEGGVTLTRYMQEAGPAPARLPPAEALRILRELAAALEHIHGHGVVHRDLKPGNVLVTGDGSCRVFDFGLARDLGRAERLTATHVILGTPLYMAPQQLLGEPPDPRDDLYALGIIAYELLAGSNPFRAAEVAAVAYRQATLVPALLEDLALDPPVPAGLSDLVAALLAKVRGDRPASATAALAVLAAASEPGRTMTAALPAGALAAPPAGPGETFRDPAPGARSGLPPAGAPPARAALPLLWRSSHLVLAVLAVLLLGWGLVPRGERGEALPSPGSAAPSPGAVPGLALVAAAAAELAALRPSTVERLGDPVAWVDFRERAPVLYSILEWIGRGGVPERDLAEPVQEALVALDRGLRDRNLPGFLEPYLAPLRSLPGGLRETLVSAARGARDQALAGLLERDAALFGERMPRRGRPVPEPLRRWADEKGRALDAMFKPTRSPLFTAADTVFGEDAGLRAAWQRYTARPAASAARYAWLTARALREEPTQALEMAVDFLVHSPTIRAAFFSPFGYLPAEVLLGGRPVTPVDHALAASLADRLALVHERDLPSRVRLLRQALASWQVVLDAGLREPGPEETLFSTAFWQVWEHGQALGAPADLDVLFRDKVVPLVERVPRATRVVAANGPYGEAIEARSIEAYRRYAHLVLQTLASHPAEGTTTGPGWDRLREEAARTGAP